MQAVATALGTITGFWSARHIGQLGQLGEGAAVQYRISESVVRIEKSLPLAATIMTGQAWDRDRPGRWRDRLEGAWLHPVAHNIR